MKIRVEGSAEELVKKARPAAEEVLRKLSEHDPSLVRALEAIEHTHETPVDDRPRMKSIVDGGKAIYDQELSAMFAEIDAELLSD